MIYTTPLHKVLDNCPFQGLIIQQHAFCLSMVHKYPFKCGGRVFTTVLQGLVYRMNDIVHQNGDLDQTNLIMNMDITQLKAQLLNMISTSQALSLIQVHLYNLLLAKSEQVNSCYNILKKYTYLKIYNADPADGVLGVGISHQELQWTQIKSIPGRNILGITWERVRGGLE